MIKYDPMNKIAAIGGTAAPFPSSFGSNLTLSVMFTTYFYMACERWPTRTDKKIYDFSYYAAGVLPNKLLFSSHTGFFLQIYSDGNVNGTRKNKSAYSKYM